MQNIIPFIGKYYSDNWVRKNVLMQTDEEINQMMEEINDEGDDVQQDSGGADNVVDDQRGNQSAPPAQQQQPRTITPNIDGAGR